MKRNELIATRKGKGLTQEQLANIAGIQRSYYGLVETGHRNPTLKVAVKIAEALDSNLETLFPDEIFLPTNATQRSIAFKLIILKEVGEINGN